MNIGIVVEGISDSIFLESKTEWFKSKKYCIVKIIPANGRGKLIKDAPKHLRLLQKIKCDRIIFFLDQDGDPCPPYTAKRLNSVRQKEGVLICVMTTELEGWLLADSEAVRKATGKHFDKETDKVTYAKEKLKELCRKWPNDIVTDTEAVKKISPYFSFERAHLRNASLRRFLRKIENA